MTSSEEYVIFKMESGGQFFKYLDLNSMAIYFLILYKS